MHPVCLGTSSRSCTERPMKDVTSVCCSPLILGLKIAAGGRACALPHAEAAYILLSTSPGVMVSLQHRHAGTMRHRHVVRQIEEDARCVSVTSSQSKLICAQDCVLRGLHASVTYCHSSHHVCQRIWQYALQLHVWYMLQAVSANHHQSSLCVQKTFI